MRDDRDLQAYLEANVIQAQIIQLEGEVRTVDQAAEAMGVSPKQIVKSLLFVAGERPVLVIALGPDRVDPDVLKQILGLTEGQLKLATPDQVLALSGYAVGTVPPIALANPMEVLIDRSVLSLDRVFAGGGSSSALLAIAPDELVERSGGQLIDMSGPLAQ